MCPAAMPSWSLVQSILVVCKWGEFASQGTLAMPGDMCDCHWREEGGIIGVKRVEASDVVKHRTMDMGQLCKKE